MAELKYDITPENAPLFAADIAETAKNVEGIDLDFSVKSLKAVDEIIGRFHADEVQLDDIAATIFGFGCYVGEVFVKHARATWRAATEDEVENQFGVPLILEIGSDKIVNPIGKVIKRLENGDEDNLPYFYRVFAK